MNHIDKITEIFCLVDDFCKEFEKELNTHQLTKGNIRKYKQRSFQLSDSEIITIMIFFHLKGFRNLKHFYLYYVQTHLINEFPKTVSYNRFVELQQKSLLPMVSFLKIYCFRKMYRYFIY